MTVYAGDPVLAADINALLDAVPIPYLKPSATGRTNNSLQNDPFLQNIPLDTGVFSIRVHIYVTFASTTPKLKTRWGFTGTWDSGLRLCHGPGSAQTGGPEAVTDATFRAYQLDGQDAIYSASTSAAYTAILEECLSVNVTDPGDFALQWAQNVTNASAVTVQPGSAILIQKVA